MVVCNEKVADREDSNPLICFTGFMTFICKVLLYPKSELSTLKASTGMVCLENRGFIRLPPPATIALAKNNKVTSWESQILTQNLIPWNVFKHLSMVLLVLSFLPSSIEHAHQAHFYLGATKKRPAGSAGKEHTLKFL